MGWKKEVLETIKGKESVVESIKMGRYCDVKMENGDIGQVPKDDLPLNVLEGSEVKYDIEKFMMTNTDEDESFTKNAFVNLHLKSKASTLKALKRYSYDQLLFIDIEACNLVEEIKARTLLYESWKYKRRRYEEEKAAELKKSYNELGTLYPEFSKVCCVSLGRISDGQLKVMSFYGDVEEIILKKSGEMIEKFCSSSKQFRLCGHAIKGYDIPFLMKRMIIHGMEVPETLDVTGMKPWDTDFVDTNDVWQGPSFNSANLMNIAIAMGLKSPKEDMVGADVSKEFYKGNLDKIAKYCEGDVFTTANIVKRMYGQDILEDYFSLTFDADDKDK